MSDRSAPPPPRPRTLKFVIFDVIVIAAVLYSIVRAMRRPSPAAALARLSLTIGIGVVLALLLGLVLG